MGFAISSPPVPISDWGMRAAFASMQVPDRLRFVVERGSAIAFWMVQRDDEDRGYLKTLALALPLLVVAAAMSYAMMPETYRPFTISLPGAEKYPVRIDLNEVEAIAFTGSSPVQLEEEEFDPVVAEIAAQLSAEGRLSDEEFAAIFRGMLGPARDREPALATVPRANPTIGPGGMMNLDFDLAAGPQDDDTIQLQMQVQHGDDLLGPVEIRIDTNSSIYVARKDMLAILPTPVRGAERLEGEFVELARLRDAGVNLRYDATADRLVLVQ
jgi:hypothetical protein